MYLEPRSRVCSCPQTGLRNVTESHRSYLGCSLVWTCRSHKQDKASLVSVSSRRQKLRPVHKKSLEGMHSDLHGISACVPCFICGQGAIPVHYVATKPVQVFDVFLQRASRRLIIFQQDSPSLDPTRFSSAMTASTKESEGSDRSVAERMVRRIATSMLDTRRASTNVAHWTHLSTSPVVS
jgi:hypothetical protein